jgi:hypothetical protein
MNINYERQNSSFAISNIMFIKFPRLLSHYIWLLSLYVLFTLGLSSCSTKVVSKLKTLQQPNKTMKPIIKSDELNITKEMDYPLSSITPDSISNSAFTFLFIIGCCLIFTFPGLILYFYNYAKGIFKRKK